MAVPYRSGSHCWWDWDDFVRVEYWIYWGIVGAGIDAEWGLGQAQGLDCSQKK